MVKGNKKPEPGLPMNKETMQPYHMRYRWIMLGLVWLLYFSFGTILRSMPPLVTPILEELKISYSQMGIILGSWPLTYIAAATISGALIDRWGIHKSLFLGIVIVGLSEFLRFFANGFTTLFLCVALFGLGGPMISIGCPKTISLWFGEKERGTAVGIYTTGTWIGGLVAYSTVNSVVMPFVGYSWRITFAYYSMIPFGIAFFWLLLAKDVKPIINAKSTSIVKVFITLIKVPNVQIILIMGLISFAITHGFNDWLPKILETGGLSPAVAGYAASIPLGFGIITVFLIPHLTPPRLRPRILILSALAIAAAIIMVATVSGALLVLGLVFYGVASFCPFPLLVLILMDLPEVGGRYMGSAGGMFFCVAEIGGFAGPFIIGFVKDLTGNFLTGSFFIAGLAVLLSMMAFFIKNPRNAGSKR